VTRARIAGAVAVVLIVCGAALALAAARSSAGAGGGPVLHGDAVWRAGAKPAPDFHLTDQNGRAVSLATLRGQPFLLVFLDSKCRTLCPIVGHQLGDAERRLGGHPVPLVTVSIDVADTPTSVASAARRWGWHGHWTWLMGSHAQLAPVWRAYGITVKPMATDINHTIAVYLIDRAGGERAGFLPPLAIPDLVSDVRALRAAA
jgi:protein SCO1/2